jgi:hypothetical protein
MAVIKWGKPSYTIHRGTVKIPASKQPKWVILKFPDCPYVRVIYDENNPEGIMTTPPNQTPEDPTEIDREKIVLNLTMKILYEKYSTRLAMRFGSDDKADEYLETVRANIAAGSVTMAQAEQIIQSVIARPEPKAEQSIARRSAEAIAEFYATLQGTIPYAADASIRAQQIGDLTEIFAHYYFYGPDDSGL